MKRISWGHFSLLLFSVSLLLAACSKSKDGATGPAGAAGTNGTPGTANVIYSGWLDVTYNLNTTDSLYDGTIQTPALADSILQKGDVKVFVNFGTAAAPSIVPLPYSQLTSSGLLFINISFGEQKISLVSDADASTYVNSGSKQLQYRWVVIPGGVASARSGIDWKNYAQVKSYLGIPD
ncbi:MAG TPA: hypothetical protein VNS58_00100 [Puia sp.]|nr:hypothetical protein [Puia sp.]